MSLWVQNFARRLVAWRRRAGWLAIELAVRSGLSRNYIGKLEKGRANPSLETICSLAEAFHCDPGDLVGTPRKDERIRRALQRLEILRKLLDRMATDLPEGEAKQQALQACELAEESLLELKGTLEEDGVHR